MFWAQALAAQTQNPALAQKFKPIAETLSTQETKILAELNGVQGKPVDIGGYYNPNEQQATVAMRPSQTLNSIIDGL